MPQPKRIFGPKIFRKRSAAVGSTICFFLPLKKKAAICIIDSPYSLSSKVASLCSSSTHPLPRHTECASPCDDL